MKTVPAAARLQALLRVTTMAMALSPFACSGHGTSSQDLDDGSLRGQLIETIATFDDGTSDTSYSLRIGDNELNRRELVFDVAPDAPPMAKVKVWGIERDGRIFVDRLEQILDPNGAAREPLIGAPAIPTTKLAMAIVDIGAGPGTVTVDTLSQRLFTNPDSVRAYYLENSFGMHDLTGKVVSTVLSFPATTCDTAGMAAMLRAQVDADIGAPSDIYLWYISTKLAACSWSGLSSGRDTFYNASAGCVVLVQEPGHSFGLSHSSGMTCKDPAGQTVAIADDLGMGDAGPCVHSEYGNPYDTMGGGCRHFSAYQKVFRTYLQKCNSVSVRKSGTFNLLPIERPCNGVQALQVPMAHARPFFSSGGGGAARTTAIEYYLVELRSPIGFDGLGTAMKPTVIINAAPKYSVSNAMGARGGGRGEHTWLLDMAPAITGPRDGTAHALALGQTFTDPGGNVSITAESVGADGAVVRVDITGASSVDAGNGETTCLDGTPISAPGPATCGDDGGLGPPPVSFDAARPIDAAARDSAATTVGTSGSSTGGGTTGAAGAATTGGVGTGGAAGSATGSGAGGSGQAKPGGDASGGCACKTPSSASVSPSAARTIAVFLLSLAALARRRRLRF